MAFVQIMEIESSKYDALADLDRQWRVATEGRRTLRREVVARDRSNPDRYVVFAFFDSYESAMENSQPPRDARVLGSLRRVHRPTVTFRDFDIIEDNS